MLTNFKIQEEEEIDPKRPDKLDLLEINSGKVVVKLSHNFNFIWGWVKLYFHFYGSHMHQTTYQQENLIYVSTFKTNSKLFQYFYQQFNKTNSRIPQPRRTWAWAELGQLSPSLLQHSAPSWILSNAENLASTSLQDGATQWHYSDETNSPPIFF